MLGEISEKVNVIQYSLSELDCQLGQLQDLSAMAVDTLTLLSASDSLYQEEAHPALCRPVSASRHILPHSLTLTHRSDVVNVRRVMAKACKSTPPSLLKGHTLVMSKLASQECLVGARESRGGRQGHSEEAEDVTEEVLNSFL